MPGAQLNASSMGPGGLLEDRRDRIRSAIVLVAFLVVSTAVVQVGSELASPHYTGWFAEARKAPWTVPHWIGITAWTVLHIGMSVAAWLVWRERHRRVVGSALSLYGSQLVLNALWRPVLYNFYEVIGTTAIWLALSILALLFVTVAVAVVEFWRVNRTAGMLAVPFLLWLGYVLSVIAALGVLN